MEAASAGTTTPARMTLDLPDSVLVIDRHTGELVDVLGDRLEANGSIAKAVAVATAALSSLEAAFGGRLLRLEVELSTGYAVAQIDKDIVKVYIRNW